MNLTRIRKAKGFTQTGLAEAIGVTQPTISRAERATPDTKLATYYDIAKALGVSLVEIFGDERTEEEERLLSTYRSLREGKQKQGWESLLRLVLDDVETEVAGNGKAAGPTNGKPPR
jgi:transcriptional regulator with XRE-family HTH domain